MIRFQTEDIVMPEFNQGQVRNWILATAASHGKKIGTINYIICSDEKILEHNRKWLEHDFYTDIITFDYSEESTISGDIYIGLETVSSNAKLMNQELNRELLRVIIHGILHLCGFKDKTAEDELNMHKQEDNALINF